MTMTTKTLSRRELVAAATGAPLLALFVQSARGGAPKSGDMVKIVEFSPDGRRKGVVTVEKIRKTDAEWRQQLTPEQFAVARKSGTDARSQANTRRITTRESTTALLRHRAVRL